jgi:ubiquinone biosynthesis protein COQ9
VGHCKQHSKQAKKSEKKYFLLQQTLIKIRQEGVENSSVNQADTKKI